MTEPTETSTLLLRSQSQSIPRIAINEEAGTSSPAAIPPRAQFKSPIRSLNWIAVVAAAIAIPLIVLAFLIHLICPFKKFPFETLDEFTALVVPVFLSLVLTSIDLNEAVPVALNILLELLIIGLLSWCIAYFPRARYECDELKILPWVCVGLAGAIALTHLVLVVLRCVACVRATRDARRSGVHVSLLYVFLRG